MDTHQYFRFCKRDNAVDVLNQLKDLVDIYGYATVEDLYDIAHRISTPESGSYGWTDLKFAKVKFLGACVWTLELPQPILLDYSVFTNKEKEKEMKDTKQTFTRDDLKAGYIIELRDGTYRSIQMVGRETLIAVAGADDKDWVYLSRGWNAHLDYTDHGTQMFPYPVHDKSKDIVAVYGYTQGSDNYRYCAMIGPENRPLLWSRGNPKKMTVKEIESALGYKIEIVSEA